MCQNVVCRDKGKTCVTDQNRKSHCVSCDLLCSANDATDSTRICGTDGVTYRNSCELRIKTCKLGRTIGIAYNQPCQSKQ